MSSFEKYFNAVAGNYADKSSKGIWAILRKQESSLVIKALDPFQGMTCLELGCGAGFYTYKLACYSPSLLIAVDISENMLRELNDSRIKRVRADIENIKFKVGFDRVLCAGAIEFLPDIKNFFSNMKNLLSATGKAVLLIPKKGMLGVLYKAFHRSHAVEISLFTIDELEYILNANNLKIIEQFSPTPAVNIFVISHA